MNNILKDTRVITLVLSGIGLLVLPLLMQAIGLGAYWIRVVDTCLIYVMLAVGLNIVVGYAGLLDLGYVAFFALGAYIYALLASPHLGNTFPWIKAMFPNGLHASIWFVIPLAALAAGMLGILLGTPVLRLRGDYLAIVTLGLGEIIRIFLENMDHPVNVTNGPKGIMGIDSLSIFGFNFGKKLEIFGITLPPVTLYYYLFLFLAVIVILVSYNLERSRMGRAWMALREDEIAAKAMGINVRNVKLTAFGMGATFGGIAGTLFASFQGFVSPESFVLMESIMIVAMVVLGGIGHLPGVILGAILLAAMPELLRSLAGALDLRAMTDGRIDDAILRQLLIAVAMIAIMLLRPRGLWPSPEHGKNLAKSDANTKAPTKA